MTPNYLPSRLIIIVLFLIAFLVIMYDATCSAEEPALALKQEVNRLKERRISLMRSETKVRESLQRARKAYEITGSQANPEDRRVVREAVATAEESLALVQNLRTKTETRLRALESVVRDRPSEKDFGVAVVQTGTAQKQSRSGVAPLHYASRVYEEDTLSTANKSFLEIYTPDAGYHMLAPDTVVGILEFDRATSLMTINISRGKVHAEKTCPADETVQCWATRYRTPNGFISFAEAETVCELNPDGSEVISVLEGAVIYREKQSKRATTVKMGEQLIIGPQGESVKLKKFPKEGIQSWWDVDLQFEM
ncbi:MAG TPA: hypothetical protein VLH56_12165 [Dissulfurispiraceae bacterium]|nr:hypothetical protein [Dissulfurispiraceae bacterium]